MPLKDRRYGAILWEASAPMDEAIRLVRAFADPAEAVRVLELICEAGERWAVVDLETRAVIAQGQVVLPLSV